MPILVQVVGLVQVAVLLLLLAAVGAALLLLLVAVEAALLLLLVAVGAALLLLAADGRGGSTASDREYRNKVQGFSFYLFRSQLSKQSALFGR